MDFLGADTLHACNRIDLKVHFLAFDLKLFEKEICDKDICRLVVQHCVGGYLCWGSVLVEDFDEEYSSTGSRWLSLPANLRTGGVSLTGVFLLVSDRVMRYSNMLLLTNLTFQLVSFAILRDMFVRADTF